MILMNQLFSSVLPTQVTFGLGCVKNQLAEELLGTNVANVLLVTDPGLLQTGLVDHILESLLSYKIETVVFSEVEPNPTSTTVKRGKEVFCDNNCQSIIAVGGGSTMDAAKSIAVAAVNEGDILDYRRGGKKVQGPLPPLYMIPTTAGTGSEVTSVSVITDTEKNRKFVIADPLIAPKIAFIDPEMTFSLPRNHIAATGMDALVHAIEAYTSNRAHPISDALALHAIRMIREHLPLSFADPTNIEAKAQMLLASTIAGFAFALSGTALVHSLSHPMTALLHVPHGVANAVLLPYVIEYNLVANFDKYAEIARIFDEEARAISKYQAAERLIDYLRHFARQVEIPEHFGYLTDTIDTALIEQLASDAMDDRGTLPNNPRRPIKQDLIEIYQTSISSI
jgi:alcohol dehydrogenase class IV